jgi:hypothetical protein
MMCLRIGREVSEKATGAQAVTSRTGPCDGTRSLRLAKPEAYKNFLRVDAVELSTTFLYQKCKAIYFVHLRMAPIKHRYSHEYSAHNPMRYQKP